MKNKTEFEILKFECLLASSDKKFSSETLRIIGRGKLFEIYERVYDDSNFDNFLNVVNTLQNTGFLKNQAFMSRIYILNQK